mmetsp:Transcript_37012/g.37478  ORF Transcript_37012/g.37478 Transcript_37012/m.37478 type:complete len:153 (+) Transcript_37012:85-543(+)
MMMPQAMTFFLFCFCLAVLTEVTEGETLRAPPKAVKQILLGEVEDEKVQEKLNEVNEEMFPAMNVQPVPIENWVLEEELNEKKKENEALEENVVAKDKFVEDLVDEVNSLKGELNEKENENKLLTEELNDEDEEINVMYKEVTDLKKKNAQP